MEVDWDNRHKRKLPAADSDRTGHGKNLVESIIGRNALRVRHPSAAYTQTWPKNLTLPHGRSTDRDQSGDYGVMDSNMRETSFGSRA
jgi:hypothetical protein